jgi:hypothetical protein
MAKTLKTHSARQISEREGLDLSWKRTRLFLANPLCVKEAGAPAEPPHVASFSVV